MLLTDLWTISISLKTILCETGSQCSSFKIGVMWHDFLDNNTSCCGLYVLKTRYLILRETIKESIPVIEPWCDKCMYNLFSSTLIQVFPYSANIYDMKWWYANNVRDMRFESHCRVKYNTQISCLWWGGYLWVVINGRETFDNCWRDPNRRNSVFMSFSVVIHESAGSREDLKVM